MAGVQPRGAGLTRLDRVDGRRTVAPQKHAHLSDDIARLHPADVHELAARPERRKHPGVTPENHIEAVTGVADVDDGLARLELQEATGAGDVPEL